MINDACRICKFVDRDLFIIILSGELYHRRTYACNYQNDYKCLFSISLLIFILLHTKAHVRSIELFKYRYIKYNVGTMKNFRFISIQFDQNLFINHSRRKDAELMTRIFMYFFITAYENEYQKCDCLYAYLTRCPNSLYHLNMVCTGGFGHPVYLFEAQRFLVYSLFIRIGFHPMAACGFWNFVSSVSLISKVDYQLLIMIIYSISLFRPRKIDSHTVK